MRIEANNLKYTNITAPIDGTVMSIAVKEGQTINASQSAPTVMKLANLNTMVVRSDVSEADVGKLSVGMPVYFTTLGAGQDRRWPSTVKRIEPTPKTQQSVVLFPVLFEIENEGSSLRPNMTTQVFFVVAQARQVLTVPMAALQQGQQIARELAAKKREEDQKAAAAGGTPAAPSGTPGAAPAGGAPAAAGGDRAPSGPGAGAPGNGENQIAARTGGPGGQGPGGSAGRQGGGGFEGRAGGGGGGGGNFGRNGGQGMQNLTPEQREEMRARFQRGGGGGPGGPGGGFGGMGAPQGMGGGGARSTQQRRGTVIVKLPDGSLEPRPVVIGVSDRVHGQVLEGLSENDVVVIGKRDEEPAPSSSNQNQNNFDPRRGGGGGFPGGGRPF
jgi:macrolide-specific efflux system membrane fusion protein